MLDPPTLDQMALEVCQEDVQGDLRRVAGRRDDGRAWRGLERVGPGPRYRPAPDVHQLDVAEPPGAKQADPAVEQAVVERVGAVGLPCDANQLQIGLEHRLAMRSHVIRVGLEQLPMRIAPFLHPVLLGDGARAEPVGDPERRDARQRHRIHLDRERDGTQQRGPGSQGERAVVDAGGRLAGYRDTHQRRLGGAGAHCETRLIEQRVGEVVGRTAHELAGRRTVGIAGQPHVPDPIGADGIGAKPATTVRYEPGGLDVNRVETGPPHPHDDLRGFGLATGGGQSNGRGCVDGW